MKNTEDFVEACRNTFHYDPSTPSFLRRKVNHRESSRLPSGSYRMVDVVVDGRRFTEYVHRVVWMIHNGVIPNGLVIDHRDRNKLNNSIDNLRLVTRAVNNTNREDGGVTNLQGSKPKYKWGKVRVEYSKTMRKDRVFVLYSDGTQCHVGYCRNASDIKALTSEAKQRGLLRALL